MIGNNACNKYNEMLRLEESLTLACNEPNKDFSGCANILFLLRSSNKLEDLKILVNLTVITNQFELKLITFRFSFCFLFSRYYDQLCLLEVKILLNYLNVRFDDCCNFRSESIQIYSKLIDIMLCFQFIN